MHIWTGFIQPSLPHQRNAYIDWFYTIPLKDGIMYKNLESRRNGTDLTFESRRNGSRRNGSRQNGRRRNESRRNGNIPDSPLKHCSKTAPRYFTTSLDSIIVPLHEICMFDCDFSLILEPNRMDSVLPRYNDNFVESLTDIVSWLSF